nr:hypothetical protein [Streptomyces sp. TP-A0874]
MDRAREPEDDTGGLALELLVHGVGGTTPEEMLDDPRTVRVTGDQTAGIYRRTEDAEAESLREPAGGEPVQEAYCWSNLTSGNSARALWLLLIPFMVANLSHWMRPGAAERHTTGRRTAVRAYGVLVRLVALSLTVLLIAAACEVALDLVAWQCAASPTCTSGRGWLGFLAEEQGGWWSMPGRRLALAAIVPAAVVGLLWWLSHRTWSAYESQPPPTRPVTEGDPEAGDRPALCLPGFWYGRRLVARLRAAHTAAGFLTVAAALTTATARYDHRSAADPRLDTVGWVLTAAILALGTVAVWVVWARGRSESRPDDRIDRIIVRTLPGTALGLLLLSALHSGWSRPGWESEGQLPGNTAFGVLAIVQGTLLVGLACVGRILYRSAPEERAALRGFAGAAVATIACVLGGLLSGGVAQRVADWMDRSGTPGMADSIVPGPPVVLSWMAAAIPPLLLVLAGLAGRFAVQTWRLRRTEIAEVRRSHPGEPEDTARSRRIAGTVARARLTDCAPWFVGATALVTLVLGGVAVVGAWYSGQVPGLAADGSPRIVDASAQIAQALGSWMVSLGFILFLASGRLAYRDASARRTIGILWDVGTFWPRAAHPFAPPCYAERAVPDLTWRMSTWTRLTGGRIVLSGHSQGSVLAAAAVWQLDRRTRRRVALLTYGSPLERLYGRWFPAYFGRVPLRALYREVHCWRNLWRRTDPIGGPVRLPGEAVRGPEVDRSPLVDPLAYGRTPEHPLPAPILGHSEYQADPAFAEERAGLLKRLPEQRLTKSGTPAGQAAQGAAPGCPPDGGQPGPRSPRPRARSVSEPE